MGFSRQEYWSGLPFPSPGDLPNPGIKPRSPALQADTLTSEPPGKPPIEALMWFNFGHFLRMSYEPYNQWIYAHCKGFFKYTVKLLYKNHGKLLHKLLH